MGKGAVSYDRLVFEGGTGERRVFPSLLFNLGEQKWEGRQGENDWEYEHQGEMRPFIPLTADRHSHSFGSDPC